MSVTTRPFNACRVDERCNLRSYYVTMRSMSDPEIAMRLSATSYAPATW
jgi:hypothetical protein